jgi:hypothetical protein
MPTKLDVEKLSFTFGKSWFVIKWDDHDGYRKGIGKIHGMLDGKSESTKAADLVGIYDKQLFIIEVKDFRVVHDEQHGTQPNAINFKGRWKELPLEIALKVRDTLAGLVGYTSLGKCSEISDIVGRCLNSPVTVISCVLQDRRPNEPDSKRKARDSELRKNLENKLSWLRSNVKLIDPLIEPDRLPDVSVDNLAK